MTPEQMIKRGRELLKKARIKEEESRNKKFVELGRFVAAKEAEGFTQNWEDFHAELSQLLGHEAATPFWVDRYAIGDSNLNEVV